MAPMCSRVGRTPVTGVALVALCVALFGSAQRARTEEAPPPAQAGDTITWAEGVSRAFEIALARNKIVMICINSTRVDGGRKEPAAEALREIVYKDPQIVGRSRDFVCVFLGANSSGDDFGELKVRFGIDGFVVSPQHIFARPDHKEGDPLVRLEYWPYGRGKEAIDALIGLMDQATERWKALGGVPTPPPSTGGTEGGAVPPDGTPGATAPADPARRDAPPDAEARAAWIQDLIGIVRAGPTTRRIEAILSLLTNDQDGDALRPLLALLADPETAKHPQLLVDLLRGLGRPALHAAVEGVAAHLGHKESSVRANAAVTLEYIGAPAALEALTKQVKREREPIVQSHIWRAIGRCGAGESKVAAQLLRAAADAKDGDLTTFGPLIALAYFQRDEKAARGVEKMAGKLGPPSFGRRGGGQGTTLRSTMMWVLARIGDPKTAEFVKERMLGPLEHVQSPWIGRTRDFYRAVVRACEGDASAVSDVENGLRFILGMGVGNPLQDAARKGRPDVGFTPLFDWEVGGGNQDGA